MPPRKVNINTYTPRPNEYFLVDNSVWMYVFCPLGDYRRFRQDSYSRFLQKAVASKSNILITSMVLSEFTNRYLRMDFELWKEDSGYDSARYKENYVGSDRYNETVEEVRNQYNRILKLCSKTCDIFHLIDLGAISTHFSTVDFNDSYTVEQAKFNKWKVVSDDRDFLNYTGHDLEIITIV